MADLKISQLTSASTPLAGTEVLPIVQSGSTVKVSVANLTAGRAVGMAGGSFTDNITQSTAAKGVNFTANTPAAGMTSQLLNWYEEGTWTATLTATTTAPTTPVTTTAYYTRVGRQVTVTAYFGNKDTTGASGTMQVTGIPFTSGIDAIGSCAKSGLGATSDAAILFASTSVVYFTDTVTQTNTAIVAGTGKYLWFSLTYFV